MSAASRLSLPAYLRNVTHGNAIFIRCRSCSALLRGQRCPRGTAMTPHSPPCTHPTSTGVTTPSKGEVRGACAQGLPHAARRHADRRGGERRQGRVHHQRSLREDFVQAFLLLRPKAESQWHPLNSGVVRTPPPPLPSPKLALFYIHLSPYHRQR